MFSELAVEHWHGGVWHGSPVALELESSGAAAWEDGGLVVVGILI